MSGSRVTKSPEFPGKEGLYYTLLTNLLCPIEVRRIIKPNLAKTVYFVGEINKC